MENEESKNQLVESIIFSWLQSIMDGWVNMVKALPPNSNTMLKTQALLQKRFSQQVDTHLNMLHSFSKLLKPVENQSVIDSTVSALPEIFLKIAKTGFDVAVQIQNHLWEKAAKIGQRAEAYQFEDLDQELFKALRDIYINELQPYLKIPPLGLTRFYQERINELLDKHNIFEMTLSEFLSILYLPVEKSFKVFQEKFKQMVEEGHLATTTKESYSMWLKILEGHYMNLFKSADYTEAMHRVLNHLEDYLVVRNEVIQDFLQLMPVVTHKDIDDLYKEFHLLKKRVKEIEKRMGISPNALDNEK